MSDRLHRQRALLGGIIVRRAAARVRTIVDGSCFDSSLDRDIFKCAMNLAAIGLDNDDEYILRIAHSVYFKDDVTGHLVELMKAFDAEGNERGQRPWLEELAHEIAAEAKGKMTA